MSLDANDCEVGNIPNYIFTVSFLRFQNLLKPNQQIRLTQKLGRQMQISFFLKSCTYALYA